MNSFTCGNEVFLFIFIFIFIIIINIIEVFEFEQITNIDRNQTFEYKWVERITGFFFFFFFGYMRQYYCFNLFCFFVGKKIKLDGMLFQNLYEDILIRQKLKTKQKNPLINSVCVYIYIYIYI